MYRDRLKSMLQVAWMLKASRGRSDMQQHAAAVIKFTKLSPPLLVDPRIERALLQSVRLFVGYVDEADGSTLYTLQRSAKVGAPGLVNYVPALA